MYVHCVLFEGEVIVNSESQVFEMVYCLYCFIVDDGGVEGLWWTKDHFFCFFDIEFEKIVFTPLIEV